MALKKNIATSEAGFVFNPSTGDSFSSNPVAADIIMKMKEGVSLSEVKSFILSKYDVEATQLEKDWDDFMMQLKDFNLLDN